MKAIQALGGSAAGLVLLVALLVACNANQPANVASLPTPPAQPTLEPTLRPVGAGEVRCRLVDENGRPLKDLANSGVFTDTRVDLCLNTPGSPICDYQGALNLKQTDILWLMNVHSDTTGLALKTSAGGRPLWNEKKERITFALVAGYGLDLGYCYLSPLTEAVPLIELRPMVSDFDQNAGAYGDPEMYSTGSFIWPVKNHWLSGWDYCPDDGGCSKTPWHPGLDLAAQAGTDVIASDGGIVIFSDFSYSGTGETVKISHGHGYSSLYGHLSEIFVAVGQAVHQGEVIGRSGATGSATGPVLYFQIRLQGARVNPWSLLPATTPSPTAAP